jgi:peptidoglycan/LPS O-acetylase OafA/YrhL
MSPPRAVTVGPSAYWYLTRASATTALILLTLSVVLGVIDAIVPFAGTYPSFWLGLGAASFDLVLAVVITSLARRQLGYRTWRFTHWFAYASWPIALLHGPLLAPATTRSGR